MLGFSPPSLYFVVLHAFRRPTCLFAFGTATAERSTRRHFSLDDVRRFLHAQTFSVGVSMQLPPLGTAGSLPRVAEYLPDCHSARCRAFRCMSDKLAIFIGKSPFQRVATPIG